MILSFFSSQGWESWDVEHRPLIPERMPVLVDADLRFEDGVGAPRPAAVVNRWLRELPASGTPASNSWEGIVSYSGALTPGAVINPVNVMLTPAEVAYVTADCGAKALIGSPEKIRPALEAGVVGLESIVFGDEPVAGATPFGELIAGSNGFDPVPVAPDALAAICYTSGTTGRPKGAMQSHRAIVLNGAITAQMHLKSELDTVVSALPCPHVYGNVVFNGALMYGLTLVMHPRFDPAEILTSIPMAIQHASMNDPP